MSRRSASHASAGPSRTLEQEPLLGSDDSSVDGVGAGNKKYASVDVRAVALVDNDDPEADCELLVWRFMSLLTERIHSRRCADAEEAVRWVLVAFLRGCAATDGVGGFRIQA